MPARYKRSETEDNRLQENDIADEEHEDTRSQESDISDEEDLERGEEFSDEGTEIDEEEKRQFAKIPDAEYDYKAVVAEITQDVSKPQDCANAVHFKSTIVDYRYRWCGTGYSGGNNQYRHGRKCVMAVAPGYVCPNHPPDCEKAEKSGYFQYRFAFINFSLAQYFNLKCISFVCTRLYLKNH
uniref:Uncharacterized protein n=1 Tax=Tetranychus urticae TaxID=32264 RepID=T1K672_TETUR